MAWWAAILGCSAVSGFGVAPELARPNRVAIGAAGEVYVSDFHHDRIVEFDPDGDVVSTFGRQGIGRNELWRVTAMAVDPDGALIVANRRPDSDAAGSETRFELIRFVDGDEAERIALDGRALQSGGWIDAIVALGPGTPARDGPEAWIVADSTNGELVQVDREGRRVGTWGGIPRPDAAPTGLVRDGDAVWVVEQARHRLTRMGPGGESRALALEDGGEGLPRFPSAAAVCAAGGWLAIADYGAHRVQRFRVDGAFLDAFAPAEAGPDRPVQLMDLAMSPDCTRLYLVDSKGDRLLVTTPQGEVLREVHAW